MARAVSMRHTVVPTGNRDEFRAKATATRSHYTGAGCRYWLYEEDQLPGAYVEFFEASDQETLERAHRSAQGGPHASARVYVEVELT
jgi:hypothetical protein